MKKITKYLMSLAFLALIIVPSMGVAAATSITSDELGVGSTGDIASNIKLTSNSPLKTAASLINTAMIFLGIIVVGIILMAGFKWMTAGGSDEKITEAKKLMSAGVVGLIIILSAWGIATFIIQKAVEAVN